MNGFQERLLVHAVNPELDDAKSHHQERREQQSEFDGRGAAPISRRIGKGLYRAHSTGADVGSGRLRIWRRQSDPWHRKWDRDAVGRDDFHEMLEDGVARAAARATDRGRHRRHSGRCRDAVAGRARGYGDATAVRGLSRRRCPGCGRIAASAHDVGHSILERLVDIGLTFIESRKIPQAKQHRYKKR